MGRWGPRCGSPTPRWDDGYLDFETFGSDYDTVLAAGRRVVVLADSSKVGNDQFARFAELSDIDQMVTDAGINPADHAAFLDAGVDVIVA